MEDRKPPAPDAEHAGHAAAPEAPAEAAAHAHGAAPGHAEHGANAVAVRAVQHPPTELRNPGVDM